MIVLLTEEPSMGAFLETILPGLWPGSVPGVQEQGEVSQPRQTCECLAGT